MSLKSYPDKYLFCAAFGHAKQDQGSFMEADKYGQARITQYFRCGCEWQVRVFFSTRSVPLGKRSYEKPPGYSPVPGRLEAQQEWMRRHPPIR